MGKIKDFKLYDPHPEDCNHDINAKHTTIKLVEGFLTMEFPRKYYGVCLCCGKSFRFIKDEKGKYIDDIEEEDAKC